MNCDGANVFGVLLDSQHRGSIFDFDFIVIGSGFGGRVSAHRLAEKGYRVAVMEITVNLPQRLYFITQTKLSQSPQEFQSRKKCEN